MKKLLFLFTLVAVMLLGSSTEAKAQNVRYNRIDVYNSYGQNATDFIFTYDKYNNCSNNIKVINNLGYLTTFNFNIYLNGSWRYTGAVTISPFGSVFFNNAFTDCNSSSDMIEIRCW